LPTNAIVKRRTPDWPSFNLDETRQFCARLGFPETLILDFAAIWDSAMRFSYLEYRELMKTLSLQTIAGVKGVDVLDLDGEVALWGSVYVGRLYTDAETAKTDDAPLHFRPLDGKTFYTNNYAVTGSAIVRHGARRLLEHYDAQESFESRLIEPSLVESYMSAANKHPCCTMAILYNTPSTHYRQNMRSELQRFNDDLQNSLESSPTSWLTPFVENLLKINRKTTGASHV
jgi:hypothetical protein